MVRSLGLTVQTMYADLVQRCLDAEFDHDFPENGSFSRKPRKGRDYWYYQGYDPNGGKFTKYVGPADDSDITARVDRFHDIKADFQERRRVVVALRHAGMPTPDPMTGALAEALWKAGLFRLRAVLVGTSAYQTYAGLLGVLLPDAQMRTGDLDVAQFHAIANEVDDTLPPILDVLREVDPTFRPVPHRADPVRTTTFRNREGYLVEFLTPNTGSDDHQDRPAEMRALGGAAAQPLRFLDFLIHHPVRAALLHGGGVGVLVPAPERYAVHKLIVAARRADTPDSRAKAAKDAAQAATLIGVLAEKHRHDLVDAWVEAWQRGRRWQQALQRGRAMLPDGANDSLVAAVLVVARDGGVDPAEVGLGA